MTDEMHSADLDVTMLVRRARLEMERGGSVEQMLRETPGDVLALMPLAVRTPDAVAGSLYDRVASGQTPARLANCQMDAACVVHSMYAWRWLQHAECEQFGMTPAHIAGCETLDLVRHDWRDISLPDRDAFDAAFA